MMEADRRCLQAAESRLDEAWGEEDWLLHDYYLNEEAIDGRGLERPRVASSLAEALQSCAHVQRAWTRSELEASTTGRDPFRAMYARSFHAERSPDVLVQFDELPSNRRGGKPTHGSPHEYDTHVPLFVLLPGGEAKRVAEEVNTVALAPTLASLLGIETPPDLDGVDRADLLKN